MAIIDKIKSNIDLWKLEKYTKRRSFLPEYESKDLDYYKAIYHDGVYDTKLEYENYTKGSAITRKLSKSHFSKKASNLLKRYSKSDNTNYMPPCSESYNKRRDI
ncbi:MAG: hypothetical protein EXX96DRAFT_653372 [Benjaminiella poitrasii]|nr:MAG: hypothetical protein EXX96DRAFT_653372 [Benjaminiella poitrasii]